MAVPPNPTNAPRSISTADLLAAMSREFIMLAGKDGAGKSCAVVSMAKWVQDVLNPNATFFVIDTENKFPTALRSFGSDAPANIAYYKCDSMNDVTNTIDVIMGKRKEGDWLATESMGKVWELAQDMGYRAVSGFDKADYLEKRRAQKAAGLAQANVIPKPDEFWSVVKGAHDGAFVDLMVQASTLNLIWSTPVSKPPKAGAFIKENETRKEVRAEFGIDAGLDGAPRIPYAVETLCMLDVVGGRVSCRVVRDNKCNNDTTRVTFEVPDRKSWAQQFWVSNR